MKYCPNCRGEYQDWVEKCIDCGSTLTDTRPLLPEPETEDALVSSADPVVTIAVYKNVVDADLVRSILESEGIRDVSVIEITPSASPIIPQAMKREAYLRVKESEALKALKIVKSITEITPAVYADIDEETDDTNDDEMEQFKGD